MDEEEIKRLARHFADQQIISLLLATHFANFPDPKDAAANFRLLCENAADHMTFPEVDPATSDLLAHEYRDAMLRTIERATALSSGQPLDPQAYLKADKSRDD